MNDSHIWMRPEKALQVMPSLNGMMDWLTEVAKSRNGLDDRVLLPSRILRDFGQNELIGRFGNREVIREIDFYIRLILPELNHIIKHSVRPEYRGEVELQDDVKVSASSVQLMNFILEDDSDPISDDKIERVKLRSKHARLVLALAIMGFLINSVDEASWIGDDLVEINQMLKKGMRDSLANIAVVATKNPNTGTINKSSLRVFRSFDEEDAESYRKKLTDREETIYETRRLCDALEIEGKTYFIYTGSRRKIIFDIISKCLRADKRLKRLKDNRGVRHSVIAVEENGELRPGNRDDSRLWANHIYKNWIHPLNPEEGPVHKRATNGSSGYWDLKILGRYHSIHEGLPISGRVEMQITNLGDELTQVGASDENHEWYAMSRFYRHVLPTMWPHFNWLTAERLDLHEAYWRALVRALNCVQIDCDP